jgi:hypothetical protein
MITPTTQLDAMRKDSLTPARPFLYPAFFEDFSDRPKRRRPLTRAQINRILALPGFPTHRRRGRLLVRPSEAASFFRDHLTEIARALKGSHATTR